LKSQRNKQKEETDMRVVKIWVVLVLAMGVIFTFIPKLHADETSEAILKILIKKGIITQQEVDQMKAEIARERPPVPAGLEERVSKLEEDVKKVPKIAHFLAGDMKIGGYIQTRYTIGTGSEVNDSITTKNSKLTLSGHVVPEVAYKLEIGPHKSPGSSVLYDAFARLEYFPKAKVTIGQFKAPFSEEYITSSSAIKTSDRALFQGNFTHEYAQGLMVDGDILDNLYYAVAGATGTDRSTSENNDAKDVYGRLVYTPFKNSDSKLLKGLKLGTAVQYGRQPRSGNNEGDRLRNLAMLKYTYNGLTFQSEYVHQKQEQIPGVDDVKGQGWYALTAYKFPVKFLKYDTELEPVFKFEQYEPNTSAARDRQDMYTFGLTWYLNKYFYLMANYQLRDWQTEGSASKDRIYLQSQVKF
jgi:hypothetical protein